MTPLAWLGVASLGGAVLFFTAGCLIAAGRSATARLALARAHVELSAHRAEHERTGCELERARAEAGAQADDRQRLADEVHRLSVALTAASRPGPPGPGGPPTGVVAEVDVLRRRLADADELRDDNARLRAEAARIGPLEAKLAAADRELAELRQRTHQAQLGPRLPTGSGLLKVPGSGSYDALVAQLTRDPRVSAAVVSDDLGLLVAGTGSHAESLAAVGGYLSGVGERAQALVSLGTPMRITVEDDRGVSVAATRLVGAQLVAVTLSRERPTLR